MEIEVVNKKTGVTKKIPKGILSDYLATKEWEVKKGKEELKQTSSTPKSLNITSEE